MRLLLTALFSFFLLAFHTVSVLAQPPAGYEDVVRTGLENPFSDVDALSDEGSAAIELYHAGVIGGFPDGTFRGSHLVNRAELAKFLLLAQYGSIETYTNDGQFPDVLDNQWYTSFVVRAAQLGIINGHPSGHFRPELPVNRAEFLKMISLSFDLPEYGPHSYRDVQPTQWFDRYVGTAEAYGLFPSSRRLYPERSMTRYEVAYAINRIMVYGVVLPIPEALLNFDRDLYIDDDPMLGDVDAPVTIVEFTDYQCPFCQRHALETFPLIRENYIETGKVRYVIRDFPLYAIHGYAGIGAQATGCAFEQGKFWEMKYKLFADIGSWAHADYLSTLHYFASEIGMNGMDLQACIESGRRMSEIDQDLADASAIGVTGTPAFFINGEQLNGALPYAQFVEVIERHLP